MKPIWLGIVSFTACVFILPLLFSHFPDQSTAMNQKIKSRRPSILHDMILPTQPATKPNKNQELDRQGGRQFVSYSVNPALLWRRLGWTPVVTFVGSEGHESHLQHLVMNATRTLGNSIIYVAPGFTPTYKDAQLARLFAACIPEIAANPRASVMISDADMFVLSNELFTRQNRSNRAHYYGFGRVGMKDALHDAPDGRFDIQMCHLHMTVEAWYEVLRVQTPCDFSRELHLALSSTPPEWGFDQDFIKSRIIQWHKEGHDQNIPGREMDFNYRDYSALPEMDGRFRPWDEATYPPGGLLADNWVGYDFGKFKTAHAPRPDGHKVPKWTVTQRLLQHVLTPAEYEDVLSYHRDYLRLFGT